MKVSFVNIDPAGGVSELDALERAYGVQLPVQYREFVLRFGGGQPNPNCQVVPDFDEAVAEVQLFLNLGSPEDSSSIRYTIEVLGWRLPDGFFPIARESGGNLYAIDLACGEVFFCDLAAVAYTDVSPAPVYRAAKSFGKFLDEFVEFDPEKYG